MNDITCNHNTDGSVTMQDDMSTKITKVYPLVCDKLAITCNFPLNIQKQIMDQFKSEKATKKGLYQLSYNIFGLRMKNSPYSSSDILKKTTAFVQCAPLQKNMKFFRIEFNPNKIDDLFELIAILETTFLTAPGYGAKYLFRYGTITRIDLAIDIAHEKLDSFLFHYEKIRRSEVIKSHSGKTIYLGGKTSSDKLIVIYDRMNGVKEMNTKKKRKSYKEAIPDFPVLRIEFRLNPGHSFKNIVTIKNPFSRLNISTHGKLEGKDEKWNLFLAAARLEGAQASLGRLSKESKKQYIIRLKDGQVSWWNPEKIWEQIGGLIDSIIFTK